MADPYYGEIRAFAFDYAPQNWACCQGQSIPLNQNPGLYSVIRNLYGGNAQTFNLPNLQGRTVMGSGTGAGLMPRSVGQSVGASTVTLSAQHMPMHTHTVAVETANASVAAPAAAYFAKGMKGSGPKAAAVNTYTAAAPNTGMAANALAPSVGGGGAHSNMQPYLALNLCICLFGEYPIRPE